MMPGRSTKVRLSTCGEYIFKLMDLLLMPLFRPVSRSVSRAISARISAKS